MESDKPPDQPAPAETVVETAVERAVENEYFSIKKHGKATVGDAKLDSDEEEEEADDPLYESIVSGAAGSVKSDTSPEATPQPSSMLCAPNLCESSDL